MKKFFIGLLVVIIGVSGWFCLMLNHNYPEYTMTYVKTKEAESKIKSEIFAYVIDKNFGKVSTEDIGDDFTNVDNTYESEVLTKMKEGIPVVLTYEAEGKKPISASYIYNDGYVFKINKDFNKFDFNKITKDNLAGHIKIGGWYELLLEYIVFLNK